MGGSGGGAEVRGVHVEVIAVRERHFNPAIDVLVRFAGSAAIAGIDAIFCLDLVASVKSHAASSLLEVMDWD
jgi:hypothetical protein